MSRVSHLPRFLIRLTTAGNLYPQGQFFPLSVRPGQQSSADSDTRYIWQRATGRTFNGKGIIHARILRRGASVLIHGLERLERLESWQAGSVAA